MTDLNQKIVIIDDNFQILTFLENFLQSENYKPICFQSSIEAIKALSPEGNLADQNIKLILSDIKMPGLDGIGFSEQVLTLRPEIPIILMTAYGGVEEAVKSMKTGVFNYILKPFNLDELILNIKKAIEHHQIKLENSNLKKEIRSLHASKHFIGESKEIKLLMDTISRIAPLGVNVLITGETGTGKKLVARAIHQAGPRAQKPFLAINCFIEQASIFEQVASLLNDSTMPIGLLHKKKNLLEELQGGTIFLEGIDDLSILSQMKILSFLNINNSEENTNSKLNIHFIASTNKNFVSILQEGLFRKDFYYRLKMITISVPPLRNRKSDIPILAQHFLDQAMLRNNRNILGFSKDALVKLENHSWNGNVQELGHTIEVASALCLNSYIDSTDIFLSEESEESDNETVNFSKKPLPALGDIEKNYIQFVLNKVENHKEKAAKVLGISRRTLLRKETEYGSNGS